MSKYYRKPNQELFQTVNGTSYNGYQFYTGDRQNVDDIEINNPPSSDKRWYLDSDERWISDDESISLSQKIEWNLLSISDAKKSVISKINELCDSTLASIKNSYPETEVETWDRQEKEARAYLNNTSSATPLIDAISLARGIDKSELVSRIISKADAWASLAGSIIGERQRKEDLIENATVEELDQILSELNG